MSAHARLGIDIGGSGIKAAVVDTNSGIPTGSRRTVPTPEGARPADVAECVAAILAHYSWTGPFGCTFPAVVKEGIVRSAANVDPSWVGVDLTDLLAAASAPGATVLNDADAAGLAEMHHGAGRAATGTTLMLTLGTGIGTALFVDRALVPNTELGHIELNGSDAERRAAPSARTREGLDIATWAGRLQEYLEVVHDLVWPDLVILGGGISRRSGEFIPLLDVPCALRPALLDNDAGLVGAAIASELREG